MRGTAAAGTALAPVAELLTTPTVRKTRSKWLSETAFGSAKELACAPSIRLAMRKTRPPGAPAPRRAGPARRRGTAAQTAPDLM